jgi:hypothetical protein
MCRDKFDINEHQTQKTLDAKGYIDKICKDYQALIGRHEFEIEELREGLEPKGG